MWEFVEKPPIPVQPIAAYVNYAASSENFLTELGKARAEKLKALLISIGVDQGRITILKPEGRTAATWQQDVAPLLPEGDAERVWFFVE